MSATCLCRSVVVSVNIFLSVSFCLRVDFRSVVCRSVVAQRKALINDNSNLMMIKTLISKSVARRIHLH